MPMRVILFSLVHR
jgi:hypothetical protein